MDWSAFSLSFVSLTFIYSGKAKQNAVQKSNEDDSLFTGEKIKKVKKKEKKSKSDGKIKVHFKSKDNPDTLKDGIKKLIESEKKKASKQGGNVSIKFSEEESLPRTVTKAADKVNKAPQSEGKKTIEKPTSKPNGDIKNKDKPIGGTDKPFIDKDKQFENKSFERKDGKPADRSFVGRGGGRGGSFGGRGGGRGGSFGERGGGRGGSFGGRGGGPVNKSFGQGFGQSTTIPASTGKHVVFD